MRNEAEQIAWNSKVAARIAQDVQKVVGKEGKVLRCEKYLEGGECLVVDSRGAMLELLYFWRGGLAAGTIRFEECEVKGRWIFAGSLSGRA